MVFKKDGNEFEVSADSVILAEGIKTNQTMFEQFAESGIETHIIGDAESIGYIQGAINSGNRVGHLL